MEKRTFDIEELYAEAYVSAINNVIDILNGSTGSKLFFWRDCNAVEIIAHQLGVKFDVDGEIVK